MSTRLLTSLLPPDERGFSLSNIAGLLVLAAAYAVTGPVGFAVWAVVKLKGGEACLR